MLSAVRLKGIHPVLKTPTKCPRHAFSMPSHPSTPLRCPCAPTPKPCTPLSPAPPQVRCAPGYAPLLQHLSRIAPEGIHALHTTLLPSASPEALTTGPLAGLADLKDLRDLKVTRLSKEDQNCPMPLDLAPLSRHASSLQALPLLCNPFIPGVDNIMKQLEVVSALTGLTRLAYSWRACMHHVCHVG